ncbi:unnamed protein product [Caenorhabditis angaria]|uniref:Uncharacterized protein n=1 Tax=Caenorhabditis angaria TaxID=860376 RepID=A0A9P1N7S3_9PELO|nr:unnamed protein product [Caenorhabditis angaria]
MTSTFKDDNMIRIIVCISLFITTVSVAVPFGRFDFSEQQDIADFSNSNKNDNVFLPFRDTPERLINYEMDSSKESDALHSEDDIFYKFGDLATLPIEKLSGPKIANGF